MVPNTGEPTVRQFDLIRSSWECKPRLLQCEGECRRRLNLCFSSFSNLHITSMDFIGIYVLGQHKTVDDSKVKGKSYII